MRGGEEKVRGGGREEKGKEDGKEQRQHAVVGAGAPCGGMAGIQEWWKEGISRRPHDLFRPGGTCASQPLMAGITLPTRWCLNPDKKKKTYLWQAGKLI